MNGWLAMLLEACHVVGGYVCFVMWWSEGGDIKNFLQIGSKF